MNVISFTVTRGGLTEQLLSETVRLERPDIEARHRGLINAIAADTRALRETEARALLLLNRCAAYICTMYINVYIYMYIYLVYMCVYMYEDVARDSSMLLQLTLGR